ncbi:DUF5916 domain-containing protein [uncultured Tenacibaculum sp.]|uniref:DUF5916 domain-containing protein n=1 Tax=uncultured Tenacibaculum sp. TaxID=174713 RepID=UPI00260A7EC1|nr:DUF5916 domain-containing protein [uncultured Tenacibaculum sp.]
MKNLTILLFICLLNTIFLNAQVNKDRKKLPATRVNSSPKIDGDLSDAVWQNVPVAKDFLEFRPDNGKSELADYKTEVKLIYDDNAIYISAKMFDPDPKNIPAEFTNRDNFGNSDFFFAMINPIDDGQNPVMFIVNASGVQIDAKVSNGNNEDYNWSAVWDSDIKFTDYGWNVEMKIPYRALRFANNEVQSWGVNFHREVRNLNKRYTWNYIDNSVGRWTQYDGLVEGFRNITPPTRLNLYPYASGTVITEEGNTDSDWSVGMDIKYGLTENFTLDATLIPDFSQVGFDNVQLNLGPFEQQFTEQRQFFTEGTELFSKGRLFYSRRIGGSPTDQFDVGGNLQNDDNFVNGKKINEEIVDNPNKVQMLNAIKISGRTKDGLGVGFFNAITEKTEATIEKTEQTQIGTEVVTTKSQRKAVTEPFTNYNIMVLDKQFNQNSAITLINTNVTRDGRFRDANATGLLWHVEDKSSTYNIDGSFRMTHISDDPANASTGYSFDTSIGKQSGAWRWEIGYNFENKDFNPNDLGILFSNNEQTVYGFTGYRQLKPVGIFNNFGVNWWYNINFQHESGIYTGTNTGLSFWSETRNRFNFGGNLNVRTTTKDYFEPREGSTSGVFFERPTRVNFNHWGNTDFRKKLALDYFFYHTFFDNIEKDAYGFGLTPRYRFNNRFSMTYSFEYNQVDNDLGYVDKLDNGDIIFGDRNRSTYENSLSGKYSFNTNASLSLAFRHNWSKVPYKEQLLQLDTTNGQLIPSSHRGNYDRNFNSWNLDLNYVWQFAPGSQLIAFYRNSINPNSDFAPADIGFSDNINRLFDENMMHTFSLRLVYFIDYNNIKKIF